MLHRFYQKSGSIFGIQWDHGSVLETIGETIHRGVCIIGDHSCAGALFAPFPYNRKFCIASVVFWYFTKPREMEIFHALAQACHEIGCTHINPSSLWPSNTIGRYYRKHGLREAETQWLGEIACILHRKD